MKTRIYKGILAGIVIFLLAFQVLFLSENKKEPGNALNFVIIVADDLSWNDVGIYGNPGIKTPNIDSLAQHGIRFDNAILTTSSCSPSRASILTGRYPHNTGAMHLHQPIPVGQSLLPQLLKDAGYYTASVGKWHLGSYPLAAFSQVWRDKEHTGTADWIRVLRARPRDKPFFFWLASKDPHRPFKLSPEELIHKPRDVLVPPFLVNGEITKRAFVRYYDEIARLDKSVGEVVTELKHQGVLSNTVLIFMSDNGRPFFRSKLSLYDSGIRTPFIISWPGTLAEGQVNKQLISAIDIAPTVLELAKLEVPPTVQGKSIVGTLRDSGTKVRDYAFAERNWHVKDAHARAVRSREYLYIQQQHPDQGDCLVTIQKDEGYLEIKRNYEEGKATKAHQACFARRHSGEEFYDVRNDPYSLNDLSADPAYEAELKKYRKILAQWRTKTADADFVSYNPPR